MDNNGINPKDAVMRLMRFVSPRYPNNNMIKSNTMMVVRIGMECMSDNKHNATSMMGVVITHPLYRSNEMERKSFFVNK